MLDPWEEGACASTRDHPFNSRYRFYLFIIYYIISRYIIIDRDKVKYFLKKYIDKVEKYSE